MPTVASCEAMGFEQFLIGFMGLGFRIEAVGAPMLDLGFLFREPL